MAKKKTKTGMAKKPTLARPTKGKKLTAQEALVSQAFDVGKKIKKRKKGTKKKIHIMGFLQHGLNSHATGMWRNTQDKINWHFSRPPYWQHMGRTMERGFFDGMFIADELAPYSNVGGKSDECVKWAVQCPVHAPETIVPIITTATKHLGVGLTLSTAFVHPYGMVRHLSSLDHLSGGRLAWNVVSSYSKSEWDAYGADMMMRYDRYARMGGLEAAGLGRHAILAGPHVAHRIMAFCVRANPQDHAIAMEQCHDGAFDGCRPSVGRLAEHLPHDRPAAVLEFATAFVGHDLLPGREGLLLGRGHSRRQHGENQRTSDQSILTKHRVSSRLCSQRTNLLNDGPRGSIADRRVFSASQNEEGRTISHAIAKLL